MVSVTRLNHAVLYVRELERSVQFYTSILGFVEVARMGTRMAFLRAAGSNNHHDLGLMALGSQAPASTRGAIGLYHLAWEVQRIEDLATVAKLLREEGFYQGASDHGATKSVYAQDPDGHEFEVTWVVPRENWGDFEHLAVVSPLNLPQELRRYGQIDPAIS